MNNARLKLFLGFFLSSIVLMSGIFFFLWIQLPGGEQKLITAFSFALIGALLMARLLAFLLASRPKKKEELEPISQNDDLTQLRKLKTLLVAANQRLNQRLFESRVMLTIWSEQEKAEDTKEFLSKLLEALLPGLPFDYGCIIIRPLAAIGPEMIFAKVERDKTTTFDIPIEEESDRRERTLWISDIDPTIKEFLLNAGQESNSGKALSLETTKGCLGVSSNPRDVSVLTLVLRQGNDYLGSLHLLTDNAPPRIGKSLQNFLINVRSQVAVLLQNRALTYAMRVDPLTRLYNRGYLNDRLREEILRSSRTNRPFTFLLLDVDHFKQVNDTYGHQAGDEVLVGLSALLKRSCRASDAICRYGGEEIAIILTDTPMSGAKIFAENLRKAVESEEIIYEGGALRITVSMGLAEYPSHGSNGEGLISKADLALYEAKKSGRNSWKCAQG